MTSLAQQYLEQAGSILDTIGRQLPAIEKAADWFAQSILAGRVVHLFGAGHSRILVEEMWPRYGSFPGFNPIVELSLTFHNLVVGANGQRQAMFLENQVGLAERILRNFELSPQDSALVISSSGCNVVPIEIAEIFQQNRIRVVALVSRRHCQASTSRHPQQKKLPDFADLVLDTGAPPGDAMIEVPGLPGITRLNTGRRRHRQCSQSGNRPTADGRRCSAPRAGRFLPGRLSRLDASLRSRLR